VTAKKKWKKKKKKDCRRKQRQQQRVPAAGLVAAGHQRLPTALSEPSSLADRNAADDRDRDGRLAVLGPPPIPVA